MSDERWRAVPGYEGRYEVSSHGAVRSLERYINTAYGSTKLLKGRVLRLQTSRVGYPTIKLHDGDGHHRRWQVHQLVARAFIGEPPGPVGCGSDKWQVNHKDGVKDNNHYKNLEWVRGRDNIAHAVETGLIVSGEAHPRAVLGESDVLEILDRVRDDEPDSSIAADYGVTRTAVRCIRIGNSWSHLTGITE